MPEGHTLHRLAEEQAELVGRTLAASSPQGRLRDVAVLDGRRLLAVEAWGKHLLQRFEGAPTVHTHLGMTGVTLRSSPPAEPRSQIRLRLATDDVAWDLIAPSACELLDEDGVRRLLDRLGPDPLRDDDLGPVRRSFAGDRRAIGAVLLDQTVIAGVGNVFRAEALHACRIDPRRPASQLRDAEVDDLLRTLGRMMREAVDRGSIVTRPPDGRYVYKQDACGRCGTAVETFALGGRVAYRCPACQAA